MRTVTVGIMRVWMPIDDINPTNNATFGFTINGFEEALMQSKSGVYNSNSNTVADVTFTPGEISPNDFWVLRIRYREVASFIRQLYSCIRSDCTYRRFIQ